MSKIKSNRLEPRATNGSLTIGNPTSYTTFEGDVQVPGYATQEWVEGIITGDIQVELGGYMPKSGGTFTGDVKHKKDIIIEPKLPNRFVNIRNRYATNADGSSAGSDSQGFGINFDLDHGNSDNNTVQWTNTSGNILSVHGGTQWGIPGMGANAKYEGEISEPRHLVNKKYVDDLIEAVPDGLGELYTLQSSGHSYTFSSGLDAPNNTSFRTESTSVQYNKVFHFMTLYDHNSAVAYLLDYTATPSTMLEIYARGVLLLKTTIKNYRTSDRGATSVMFDVSGVAPSVHDYTALVNNSTYQVVLTNMRKISVISS